MRRWALILMMLVSGGWAPRSLARGLTPLAVKQVAAPPSDITTGVVVLPDAADLGVTSRSALLAVDPVRGDNGVWSWSVDLPVGIGGGRVVLMPAQADAWSARLVSPSGIELDARQPRSMPGAMGALGVTHASRAIDWGGSDRLFDCFTLDGTLKGTWRIEIESNRPVGGFVLVGASSERALYTNQTSLRTLKDQPITLASSFTDATPITALSALVRTPSNKHFGVVADPGASEITFTPDETGPYALRVIAQGTDAAGNPFVLTTQHLIDVARPAPALGRPTINADDDRIGFTFAPQGDDRRVILASEVWGRREGKMVPVCWLARICASARTLTLDTRWIALGGVDPRTLELRRTRIHDIDSMVPLEIIERTPVPVAGITLPVAPETITADMLVSIATDRVPTPIDTDLARGALPGGHRLLLVHGYCSDGNPFPTNQFSGDLAAFDDPFTSRSNDAFALQILAQTAPMKSFGVVAHSQGAMAALHLSTFYLSPMDWARGERLIQSVGAPYQGTALAGNAAVLGDIFGFGCGENADMTYAGSASWLSTIPTASRQRVWYWTTSFEDRPFVYDYCNFITDLLLGDPNDGVVEQTGGQLPGAHNMGHTEDWCHTDGMRDPPQCTDASRNTQINLRAMR